MKWAYCANRNDQFNHENAKQYFILAHVNIYSLPYDNIKNHPQQ